MKKITTKATLAVVLAITVLMSLFSTTVFAANDPQIDPNEQVSLTLHKYDVPEDSTGVYDLVGNTKETDGKELAVPPTYEPLKDVTFAAYLIPKTAEGEITAEGKALQDTYENTTNIPDPATYTAVAQVTTGADGIAKFESGVLEQGRYLIVETESPDYVTQKAVNFVVDLPYTNADQATWNYNVHVYPKNYTLLGAVELTKTVNGEPMDATQSATFNLEVKNADGNYVLLKEGIVVTGAASVQIPDLLKGDYRFVETDAPEGFGLAPDKYFSITKDASVEVVEVTIDNNSEPVIDKVVSEDGGNSFGNSANVDADFPAVWQISPAVPKDIATYTKFIVTDQVDSRLIIDNNSVVVKSGDTVLTEGDDYLLVINNNLITVTFIDETFIAGQTSLDPTKTLTIAFDTTIDLSDPATMASAIGTDIPNQAHLTFNNGFDVDKTVDSDQPVVHTGGKKFIKVDAADVDITLAGAEFNVYATKADAEDNVNPIVENLVSAADGTFEVTGLAYGTYYLVETKAPEGYQLNEKYIEFIVSATSYDDGDSSTQELMVIKNVEKPILPITGGAGTMMFTIVGLALVGLATVLFARYRKSRKTTV